ncbi:nucleoside hydrolase-like domain-containing protein [Actinomadura sp. NPDC000600]|uniref:DUF1593 domain-containing protein n=1 Tax=Actinomadura sp. NPDC000600 TaxID=3154262 RepID=UPI0033961D8C
MTSTRPGGRATGSAADSAEPAIRRREFMRRTGAVAVGAMAGAAGVAGPAAASGGLGGHRGRPRVIWCDDVGGTDPDDWQCAVHFLVYADLFDIEGLVQAPFGDGTVDDIFTVIDAYERDFPNLLTYSPAYPAPGRLRALTVEGAPGYGWQRPSGFGEPSEGSNLIVERAHRRDPRPLHLLIGGGLDDLAQALHDAPDILPKLRVLWIGGPNKMWSVDAYDYIETRFPDLWIIESNSTYRGWFTGGDQTGDWGNTAFVAAHIAGRGALGDFFAAQRDGEFKMGDGPNVAWFLRGGRNPEKPSWGGRYVPVWDGRKTVFDRMTTRADIVEACGVTEFVLPVPDGYTSANSARMMTDGRVPSLAVYDGRTLRFRFSPKAPQVWSYRIESDFSGLDGLGGEFTAVTPSLERAGRPSTAHPNWWCDDQDPAVAEGIYPGAKSVSRWRRRYLSDFAARIRRCEAPARRPAR